MDPNNHLNCHLNCIFCSKLGKFGYEYTVANILLKNEILPKFYSTEIFC